MNEAAKKSLMATMQKQVCTLLAKNRDAIFDAYESALQAHGDDGDDAKRKFSYPVAIGLKLSGAAEGQYDVDGKIAFAVRTKDEIHDTVRTSPDLVDQMNRATGEPDKAEEFDLDVGLDAEKGNGSAEAAPQTPKKGRGRSRAKGAAAGH